VIETLEEKFNALEEIEKDFVACDNTLDNLGRMLDESMPRNIGVDLPREGHQFQKKSSSRVRTAKEWMLSHVLYRRNGGVQGPLLGLLKT